MNNYVGLWGLEFDCELKSNDQCDLFQKVVFLRIISLSGAIIHIDLMALDIEL